MAVSATTACGDTVREANTKGMETSGVRVGGRRDEPPQDASHAHRAGGDGT